MSTPTLVPAADRAPSLASRVVTIHATDVTEGTPAPDHFTFSLPSALRVPSDDVILRPGGVKVRLVDGKASVRLPVYSTAVQTIDGSTDWVIKVSPSWGYPYAIRVPAGTSAINLADLPAVRPLSRREQMYAITGVGVTVTEATQAGGSASYVNGQLDLKIQVPSFRPATVYPYIDQQVLALTDQREQEIRDDLDERLEQVTTAYDLAVEMGYDGDLSEWLESLVGPQGADSEVPGPPNVLTIGEVTTGDPGSDAAATITGTAPEQVLGLTIPRGDKGVKGDKGDASTVPGPMGKTAYEYAVDGGFEGTEEEFAAATLPDTVTWLNIDSKPTEYPPETHTHTQEEVDGLEDVLAQLTYDSGELDWTGLLAEGWTGTISARRMGAVVYILFHGVTAGTGASSTIFTFPPEFLPAAVSPSAVTNRVLLHSTANPPDVRRVYFNDRAIISNAVVGEALYGGATYITTAPIPA